MINSIPPGIVMVLGALLLPLVPRKWRSYGALLLSLVSLALFWMLPADFRYEIELFGQTLTPIRVDSLSWVFGLIFHLAAVMAAIYALHVQDPKQHIAAMVYAGGAIGAACAGDLVTLFVFWELTAISSVILVWANGTRRAYDAGMRYLIIQVGSGVLLLSGAIMQFVEFGSLEFDKFIEPGSTMSTGVFLIFLAFGIKAAFPLMHNWLQDSYPESTATGTVYLSAFTTKLAIYALARGFPGTEVLIWIGCAMTLFPIAFAVIENDLRRVLAYSLNNQLGFMVTGIGIGTEMAINGTVAHAFCHIIYKALLFMSMGAVLYRVGTVKATELGGLHKSMPWTTLFCLIGAGSISGFPLLSGFISKSMIVDQAAHEHMFPVWLMLLIASAGVMEHSGIKIPFFAFFAHDSGKRPKEAPWNMLLAMGIAALLCIGLGIGYQWLYQILPYPVEYVPYTSVHVVTMLQLLLFATLAFVFLVKSGFYPEELRRTNLDSDWIYRRLLPRMMHAAVWVIGMFDKALRQTAMSAFRSFQTACRQLFSQNGPFGGTWTTATMAIWATILLCLCLLIYFL